MGLKLRGAALLLVVCAWPRAVHAGGPEFPGGNARSLGRGAAAFARADDPSVMIRNPALLANLWDDQAMIGAHLLLADACMQPTGGFGWATRTNDQPAADFGDGPILLDVDEGARDLDGNPIMGYGDEPYPEVCYQGPAPFLPSIGLSMKLTDDIGVGLGFFPPDVASLNQWGNRDGTIDTPNGKRPNPLRFFRSHLNTSFFTLLGAAGFRPAPWLSLGFGFQWNVVAYSSTAWSTPQATFKPPTSDVRADVFGRDLFIPGVVGSINLKPFEALDISLGARWIDRVKSNAKLDLTTGAFGTGEIYEYMEEDGTIVKAGSSIPNTSHNRNGVVDSPPIYVPQFSVGLRFADRLQPLPKDQALAHKLQPTTVLDSMQTERWDIEVDAVYYLTSTYDHTTLTNGNDTNVELIFLDASGNRSRTTASAGQCQMRAASGDCIGNRVTETSYGGKDQFSFRVGGDYNLFPGLLALRAGASYETSGQDVQKLNVLYYLLDRIGIHAGFTVRIAGATDISFGFAHFIQKKVHLQVNPGPDEMYPLEYKTAKYHFQSGAGVDPLPPEYLQGEAGQEFIRRFGMPDPTPGSFDGNAQADIPNGDNNRTEPGPHYVNAGSYFYNLDVISLSITQHF